MLLIIKFYYCKICSTYIDKHHINPHEIDDEYFGYQVFYNEIDNKYYIEDKEISYIHGSHGATIN